MQVNAVRASALHLGPQSPALPWPRHPLHAKPRARPGGHEDEHGPSR